MISIFFNQTIYEIVIDCLINIQLFPDCQEHFKREKHH